MLSVLATGCEERQEFDRWPMDVAFSPFPVYDPAWRSPQDPRRLEVSHGDPFTVAGPITALCHSPDMEEAPFGLFVFHQEGVDRYKAGLVDDGPVPVSGGVPLVRAGLRLYWPEDRPPWLMLMLITGGTTDGPAPTGEAEPPPWLMGGEVRLAWFEGGQLVIGEPELPTDVNPWRIRAGGLVFVYNRAPFDDVMRRRPWMYRVVMGEDGLPHLEPRWRGTSFSHPFRDATFCNLTADGSGEIAALEVAEDGGRLLTAYHFEGFGLEGMAPSRELPEVEDRVEPVFLGNDETGELLVRATGPSPQFIFLGLRGETEPELVEVARADSPTDLLGWLPLGEDAGIFEIFCLKHDGETEMVELDTRAQRIGPQR